MMATAIDHKIGKKRSQYGGAGILVTRFDFGVEAVFITAAISLAIYAAINAAAIYFGAWRRLPHAPQKANKTG